MTKTIEAVLGREPRYRPPDVRAGSRMIRVHHRPNGWFVLEDAGPSPEPPDVRQAVELEFPHIVLPLSTTEEA